MKLFQIVLVCALGAFSKINSNNVKVKVDFGTILGLKETTVFEEINYFAFYRIPYAQPPVKNLRFKDPQKLKKLSRQLKATKEYRGACAQDHIVHKHGVYGHEDCLYLNIYTPCIPKTNKEDLKAVIVFVHGYAFTSSFSHIYGPDFLIDNEIVVVTLTHRLGALGFTQLNDTDSSANMGLKDIVMALKWIRRNIGHFGGDKRKITVMACGSASVYVSLLLVTKNVKLFSKLILHSGSIYSPSLFQGNYLIEKNRISKELRRAGFKSIESAPTENIIEASRKIYNKKELVNSQRPLIPFLPIQEKMSNNSLLHMKIEKIYDTIKDGIKIPILTGFTSQEGITEAVPFIHNPHYFKSLYDAFKYMVPFSNKCNYEYSSLPYKVISDIIKKQYFKQGITQNSVDDLLKYVSDLKIYPVLRFIKSITKSDGKVFVYKFNYIGKLNVAKATSLSASKIKIKGAAQGDELCYILKCNPIWESYVNLKYNKTHKDRIFITQISQMWANFAKFGDPTPFHNVRNVTWLPTSSTHDHIFNFDKRSKLGNTSLEQNNLYEFWTQLYKKYYSTSNCMYVKDEL